MAKTTARWLLFLLCLLVTTACVQRMAYQPYYRPLEASAFFADGQASRPLVEGTVARGMLQTDSLLHAGQVDGQAAEIFPFHVTDEVLARGQERFGIYCTPCHGAAGDGDGMVVQRGFPAPPSLHEQRLQEAPVGYIFTVITNGYGIMPSYGAPIPAQDRWAIIAYVRALQLSQNAPVDDLPPTIQQELSAAQ